MCSLRAISNKHNYLYRLNINGRTKLAISLETLLTLEEIPKTELVFQLFLSTVTTLTNGISPYTR